MRPEKANIVEDVREKLSSSPFLIIVEYTRMTVPHFAELRTRLAAVGSEMHVIKNTFLKLAAKENKLPAIDKELTGQNAMITGEQDICAAAKILKTFYAEFEKPLVKTAILDHAILTLEQVKVLADLPSRDVLCATFLRVLLAPATQLVRTLNEPGTSLARILKAKADL